MATIEEQQRLERLKAQYEADYKATILQRRSVIRQLNDPNLTQAERDTLNAQYEQLDAKAVQLDTAAIDTSTQLNRVTNEINQGPNPPIAGPGSEIPPFSNQNTGGSPSGAAAPYQQAVADDQVRLNDLNQQLSNTNSSLTSIEQEKAALAQQLGSAAPGSPEQAAILEKRNVLNQRQAELETQREGLQQDIVVRENSLATNKNNLSLVEGGTPERAGAAPESTMAYTDPAYSAPAPANALSPDAVVGDPYVDQETFTEFTTDGEVVWESADDFNALDNPYEDQTTFTEFTADGNVEWESADDFNALDNPYQDTEGTEEFGPPQTLDAGVDPYGGFPETEVDPFGGFPENTEAGAVDPEEDPYAKLVQDTEDAGGLVEFTADGAEGRSAAEIQATADQQQAVLAQARAQAALREQRRQANEGDWRVKLRLAPGANYLYRADDGSGRNAGILQPLADTDGVVFPYTPQIQTSYKANYSSYDLTHSNYRGYFYQGSAMEEINLTATFTAQDTSEANYLLAVIHFFRSVTKMFYGQDVERGAPPPLVFLQGLGEYQFNLHPCVVSQFNYNLPNDVDYIRAGSPNQLNTNLLQRRSRQTQTVSFNPFQAVGKRLEAAKASKGAVNTPPPPQSLGTNRPTYVPTKMDISITLLPVQSREQVSKQFSLKQYANGDLLKGGFW